MTKSSWCSGVAAGGLVQQKQRDGGNGQWILMDYIVNEGKGGIKKGFYPHAVQCSHKIREKNIKKKKEWLLSSWLKQLHMVGVFSKMGMARG